MAAEDRCNTHQHQHGCGSDCSDCNVYDQAPSGPLAGGALVGASALAFVLPIALAVAFSWTMSNDPGAQTMWALAGIALGAFIAHLVLRAGKQEEHYEHGND